MTSDQTYKETDTQIITRFAEGAELLPKLAWLQQAAKNKVPVLDSEATQERHESCMLKINHLLSSSCAQNRRVPSSSKSQEGFSVEEVYVAEAAVRLFALCQTRGIDIIPAIVNTLTNGIVQ